MHNVSRPKLELIVQKVRWNLRKAGAGSSQVAPSSMLLAELGSFSMEFARLSQITGDLKWYDAIARITRLMKEQQMSTKLPGMWPLAVDGEHMDLTQDTTFTLASMSDSAYEYLPKTYAMLGGVEPVYKDLYEKAASTAIKHALYRPMTPEDADILATSSVYAGPGSLFVASEFQHLSCYTGGMFALGGKLFNQTSHVSIGRKLTDGCIWAYKNGPAGIMPEVSELFVCPNATHCTWDEKRYNQVVKDKTVVHEAGGPLEQIVTPEPPRGFTLIKDTRYILRPEAIESVFIMYRITGEQQFQAAAWDMWVAIQTATDTELGNAAIGDITSSSLQKEDSMEVRPCQSSCLRSTYAD
jgi:mannosyl-oligosaccharide alpha-1,2-mannosidase